jgi:hypothetical protein
MKKLAYQSFLIVIFCILLSTTSCKVVEKYIPYFNKQNNIISQNDSIIEDIDETVFEDAIADEDDVVYYDEDDI